MGAKSANDPSLLGFANAIRAVLDLEPLPERGNPKARSEEERFFTPSYELPVVMAPKRFR